MTEVKRVRTVLTRGENRKEVMGERVVRRDSIDFKSRNWQLILCGILCRRILCQSWKQGLNEVVTELI